MAEQNPLTPEENLLRIIESPPDAVRGMRPRVRVPFDLKFSMKMLQVKYGDKIKKLATFKTLNTVFFSLGVLTTLFMFSDFWFGMPRVEVIQRLEESAKTASVGNLAIEQLKPLALYLQEITGRNIFALVEAPPSSSAQPVPQSNPVVEDIITAIRVVGIIWSDTPQAILEDTKTNSTQLVNRGTVIKGARVKDILKDRVILSYDNKDIELR